MITIVEADTNDLTASVKHLFQAYAQSLDFDLDFQNFDQEIENFPGQYAGPGGLLLLALKDGAAIGCVGLRPIDNGVCEMKRLYVKKRFRNLNAGKKLVDAIIQAGKKRGYKTMRLDTLPSMERANRLYHSFGFRPIKPYRYNPMKGAIYLELTLN